MSNITTAVRDTNTNARIKRTLIKFLEYLALLLACFIALLPIVSSFTTSFKTAEEYAKTNAMALPQNWLNFDNYVQVWTEGEMLRAFLTSASVVIVVVTVSVMMGSMLAYVLNRFRFPGNGLIRNLFMVATLIPGIAIAGDHLPDHEGPGAAEFHFRVHVPDERNGRDLHLHFPAVF